MKLSYNIKKGDTFYNVLDVLKSYFEMSERLILKLKRNQMILLNNSPVSVKNLVNENDLIEVLLDYEEDNSNIVENSDIPLNIVYEDDCMLIVEKPAHFAIHPSILHYNDSLSNAVKFYFNKINLHKKIRPVNRLDRDTSGLVIFAKNEYIQECLIKQMQSNTFKKYYIAIVEGKLEKNEGTIDKPIARKENSIIERCISENGSRSITHYKVLNYDEEKNISYVKCTLETGRTHQLRVHLASIGHPIVGDTLYGSPSPFIDRQALHAYKISFVHPISKEQMQFELDYLKL